MVLDDFIKAVSTKAGVYQFYVYPLGKYYIGESLNIRRRVRDHLTGWGNKVIFETYKNHGLDALGFQILWFDGDKEKRCTKEQLYKLSYGKKNLLNKTLQNEAYFDPGNYRHKKRVMEFSFNGELIKTWDSAKQAALGKGGFHQCVTECARGARTNAYKRVWIYEDDYTEENLQNKIKSCNLKRRSKKVNCFNLDRVLLNTYSNVEHASKKTNSLPSKISACCNKVRKTHNNFKWSYENE